MKQARSALAGSLLAALGYLAASGCSSEVVENKASVECMGVANHPPVSSMEEGVQRISTTPGCEWWVNGYRALQARAEQVRLQAETQLSLMQQCNDFYTATDQPTETAKHRCLESVLAGGQPTLVPVPVPVPAPTTTTTTTPRSTASPEADDRSDAGSGTDDGQNAGDTGTCLDTDTCYDPAGDAYGEGVPDEELDDSSRTSGESQFEYGCEQGYITEGC